MKINRLKEELINSIEICKKGIELCNEGKSIEANIEQINFVIDEFTEILSKIENDSLHDKDNRYQLISMWNITHEWGWDIWNESDNMVSLVPKINKVYLDF